MPRGSMIWPCAGGVGRGELNGVSEGRGRSWKVTRPRKEEIWGDVTNLTAGRRVRAVRVLPDSRRLHDRPRLHIASASLE